MNPKHTYNIDTPAPAVLVLVDDRAKKINTTFTDWHQGRKRTGWSAFYQFTWLPALAILDACKGTLCQAGKLHVLVGSPDVPFLPPHTCTISISSYANSEAVLL